MGRKDPLKTDIEVTEREAGQLMCLLAGDVPHPAGLNMTSREQEALMQKFRKAVWELYYYRRANGMPTEIDKTGILVPEEEEH